MPDFRDSFTAREVCELMLTEITVIIITSCACAYCATQSVHSKNRPAHWIAHRQLSEKELVIRILAPPNPAIFLIMHVLLGSDWLVISEDERLQKVIKMTKGKGAFQRTFSRVRSL